MTYQQMLQIEILDNKRGGHEDLIFSLNGLVNHLSLDTYYFVIQIEPYKDVQDIKKAVAMLLHYWLTEIQKGEKRTKIIFTY